MLPLHQKVSILGTKLRGTIVGRTREEIPKYDVLISTPRRHMIQNVTGEMLSTQDSLPVVIAI